MVILLTLSRRILRFSSMSHASFLLLLSWGAIRKEMSRQTTMVNFKFGIIHFTPSRRICEYERLTRNAGTEAFNVPYDPPKFWIQSSPESPEHGRMRSRRLPDPRPIPEGVRGPICMQKKEIIWSRWHPVPVKYAITRGPPVVAVAVSSDPILPHR